MTIRSGAPTSARLCALVIATAATLRAGAEPAPGSTTTAADDRLVVNGEWTSLTDSPHGSGAALAWVQSLAPETQASIGGAYHSLADARWEYASIGAAWTHAAAPAGATSIFAEIGAGSGHLGTRPFDYDIVTVSVSRTLGRRVTLAIEDRQIEVDTTHANLPKLTASWGIGARARVGLGYARSVGGNTDTELASARADYQAPTYGLLAGVALGRTSAAVINLPVGAAVSGGRLRESFIGVSHSQGRADVQLIGDYLKLSGSTRLTVTLGCTVHMRDRAR